MTPSDPLRARVEALAEEWEARVALYRRYASTTNEALGDAYSTAAAALRAALAAPETRIEWRDTSGTALLARALAETAAPAPREEGPRDEDDDYGDECRACGGEGFSRHDCGEDSCCCAAPEPNVRCSVCHGSGERPRAPEPESAPRDSEVKP